MTELIREKTVTVYSTSFAEPKTFTTKGQNYGEIKSQLRELGLNTQNMKFVLAQTRLTMEHDNSMIPNQNFAMYAFPQKSSAGADKMNRKEAYTAAKALITKHGDKAAAIINKGRNYTNKSTDEIIKLVGKVTEKLEAVVSKAKPVARAKAAPKAKAVAKPAKAKTKRVKARTSVVKTEAKAEPAKSSFGPPLLVENANVLERRLQSMENKMKRLEKITKTLLESNKGSVLSEQDHQKALRQLSQELPGVKRW